MRNIIFLILFLSVNSFAANYLNEFPTYVYGDIRPIAAIYNSIAMVTDNEIYRNLINLAVLFSVLGIGWHIIVARDLLTALKSISFIIGMVAVLLVPVDVHLVDKRLDKGLIKNYYHDFTLGYEKISNIPWLIALTPSIATTLSSDLIEMIDTAFKGNSVNYPGMQDIGNTSYSSLGYNKAYDIINSIVDKYTFDEIGTTEAANFKKDFKLYLVDCVIPKTVSNALVTTRLINPNVDIYSAISPDEIGTTSNDEVLKQDGTITDCVTFYNEIIVNLRSLTSDTYSTLSKISGINDIRQIPGINNIMLADIQSSVFTNTTEQLAIYAQNLAAAPLIKATIEDYYRGTGLSGQEIANSITASKSNAILQTQGLGQFKWMAEILPYAMHFLFGIILAVSIFTLLMMLARGTLQGTAIAKNYFSGFIQFEAIRVSIAIVNNLVMYYATINAADKLVEFGGNPLSAARLPAYLEYVAKMEGVSGILAVSAIFLIPAIAMKGDVASIASSMQGLGNRYVGNDLDTAKDAVSKSSARQKAVGTIMSDEEAMKKLDSMGISVPKERMPLEYYNSLTNDLSNISSGIGNMLSQDKMGSFSRGTVAGAISKISQTSGYGSEVDLSSASNVAFQNGQVQAYQTNATQSYRERAGWNAASVGTGRAIQDVGKDMATMATSNLASSSGFDSFIQGSYNQGAISTAKTQGAGGLNLSSDDLNKIGDTVKASIQSEIGKGAGVQENYKRYGSNAYLKSSEYGERSNLSKTMEKISAQGGINNAVNIDANESMIKANQQEGSVDGMLRAYRNSAKASNRSIGDVIESISRDLSEGKTSSDIRTVSEYNNQYKGGYVQAQLDNASMKAGQNIGVLTAQENAGFIDSSGMTDKGMVAYKIRPMEQASQLDAIHNTFYGKNAANTAESIVGQLSGAARRAIAMEETNKAKDKVAKGEISNKDIDKYIEQQIDNRMEEVYKNLKELGIYDKDGNAVSGDAMVKAFAKMGAMNYAGSKSLAFNGMNISMGIDSTQMAKIHSADGSTNISTGNADTHNNLSRTTTGDISERFKGESLNYDALMTLLGNGQYGELAKEILTGLGLLGTGYVAATQIRNIGKGAKNKFQNHQNKNKGNVNGNGDNGKEKWFDPNDPISRDEYLDNNKGAKSRVDFSDNNLGSKMSNFMTEAQAKASGVLDTFSKVPFVGKVAGLAMAGATLSEANEAFNQGNYGKGVFTTTSIVDPTGFSEMALATIESRELVNQATRGRTITAIGPGWEQSLANSPIGKQISGLFGDNEISANNFSKVLQDGQVRNELGNIYTQQLNQSKMQSNMEEQLQNLQMLEMKNIISGVSEQMKTLPDVSISKDEYEDLLNEFKRLRRR